MSSLTKFVISHQPRSGSTLIWGILSNHPQIYCEREIFHQRFDKHQNYCYANYKSAKEYIETFYSMIDSKQKAFGFKLQGYQARPNLPDPETELIDIRDLIHQENYKVIIPYRLNKLDQFVSMKIAFMHDVWQSWQGVLPWADGTHNDPPFKNEKVVVNEQEFKKWYKWEKDLIATIEREAEGLETLRVTYERFLVDWEGQINRMLRFLNVEEVSGLKPKTRKAREGTLRDWIENYDEACEIHDAIADPYEIEYRIEHQ